MAEEEVEEEAGKRTGKRTGGQANGQRSEWKRVIRHTGNRKHTGSSHHGRR